MRPFSSAFRTYTCITEINNSCYLAILSRINHINTRRVAYPLLASAEVCVLYWAILVKYVWLYWHKRKFDWRWPRGLGEGNDSLPPGLLPNHMQAHCTWWRQKFSFGGVSPGSLDYAPWRKSPSGAQRRSLGEETSRSWNSLQTSFTDFDCRNDHNGRISHIYSPPDSWPVCFTVRGRWGLGGD